MNWQSLDLCDSYHAGLVLVEAYRTN